MEKQKAPIKPINGDIVGTATANKTAAVTKTVLEINQIIHRKNLEYSVLNEKTIHGWKWKKKILANSIPHDIVDEKWSLCEFFLHWIPCNLNAYEKLQTKRTEHGQCNEYFNHLSWPAMNSFTIFCVLI